MKKKKLKICVDGFFGSTNLTRLLLYFFCIFLFGFIGKVSAESTTGSANFSKAEDVTVKGQITDEDGNPLVGVSVRVTGTQNGTVSGEGGNYSINLSDRNDSTSLTFSSIGFEKQTVLLNGRTVVNVQLKSSTGKKLDELVVIGYGTSKKSDLTGAVGSVKSEDLLAQPIANALEGLQGRTAGLNVSLNGGAPGGMPSVVLRGVGSISSSTSPLYVVDGVATSNIQNLNPYNIESIEVLKDASATAIYGARGSNGVILVTTKRGAREKGVDVAYHGWIKIGNLPRELPVLNSKEFLSVLKEGMANNSIWGAAARKLDLSNPLLFDSDGNPKYNTNWQKAVTRTAFSHNHAVSIQEKGDISSAGVFLNYANNEGIMLNSYEQRYSINFTYDLDLADWVHFGTNIMYNHTNGNIVPPTTGANTPTRTMIEMPPIFPVKLSDGSYANNTMDSNFPFLDPAENPVKVLLEQVNLKKTGEVFNSSFLNFDITKNLQFKTTFGLDILNIGTEYYSPSDLINLSANEKGIASQGITKSRYWQQENYLTYDKSFGRHHLNLVVGASWQEKISQSLSGSTQNFANDYYKQFNLGAGSQPDPPGSGYQKWAMNSYYARVKYNYAGKYLLTATERIDGSSRFGTNKKYGSFPSFGVGYILSEEDFMKNINAINFLKLRGSYGSTGNTEIGSYQSLATISSGTTLLNGSRVSSSYVGGLANPQLSWEKNTELDVGIELQLFNSRIKFEGDYYHKLTDDLLLNKPLPTSTGFSSVLTNIGSVLNEGFEMTLNTINVQSKDFLWQTSFVASYNKNTIRSLGEKGADIFPGPFWGPVSNGFTILREGEAIGSFYGYERLGTYSTEEVANELEQDPNFPFKPGEEKESDHKMILGKGSPTWQGSFVNTFRYKDFSLMVDLQFSQGASVAQAFLFSSEDRTGYSNSLKTVLNGWTPENQNTDIQQLRFAPDAGQSSSFDSRWVADGSFIRGRNIVLSYNFNPSILEKLKIKNLRVYLSGQNVFLIKSSSYLGYDPQSVTFNWNSSGTPQFGQNIEFYQYPKARTFTFGVDISL
ncbi:MAG TPA: TonB-dependent receptor [Chitinophagaceae bacterium]|nr:TonB-dependent receptor [Chitinophagaceae bacterium]